MNDDELSGQERTDDERRAEWERFTMTVCGGDGGGYVNVRNDSYDDDNDHIHSVHVEDGEADGCSCPHALYRDAHCKHQVAVEQRPLVLSSADAASASAASTGQQVATDGGETLPEITHHVEPEHVGGERYARCEGCGAESIFSPSSILHDDDCARAEEYR